MSLVFNGSTHTTSTTSAHTYSSSTNWTMNAWVKIYNSGASSTMSIISEQNVSNNSRQSLDIRYVNGDIVVEKTFSYLFLIFTNYRSITVTSATTITPEVYHHIAVTWNGTTLSLYINGVLQDSTNSANNDNSLTAASNTIGARKTNTSTWNQYFRGEILDLRKYTIAADAGLISTMATCSGLDFITQDLSYRYFCHGVAGNTATQIDDWSANNLDRPITTTITYG